MGGSGSSRAVFSRLWEAYGHGRLDDALHLIDPDCTLRVSVTDRIYRGHALVVPREHATDLLGIGEEDLSACAAAAKRLAARAKDALGADGVNLLNSCGSAAWQTVFHFHVHVIPRYRDDPLRLPWIPGPGDADEIAAAGAALRA